MELILQGIVQVPLAVTVGTSLSPKDRLLHPLASACTHVLGEVELGSAKASCCTKDEKCWWFKEPCPSVAWSLILSLPQLADCICCPVSSPWGSWKKIPTQIYKAHQQTENKGEKPAEATDSKKDLFLTLLLGWCPFPAIPLPDLQLCDQELAPQAFSTCPAAEEGRQLQSRSLGLRENLWHKPEGTGSWGAVFTPGVGSSSQAVQCTWKICKLGSVCWLGLLLCSGPLFSA